MDTGVEYLEAQVLTASPEQLHLMVIDGALRFARHGLTLLEQDDIEKAHESFSRSREFVNEMIVGLNGEQNEQLVDHLKGLFLFVHRALVDADGRRDVQQARDAIHILETHRETWIEVMEKALQESLPEASVDPNTQYDSTTTSWLS